MILRALAALATRHTRAILLTAAIVATVGGVFGAGAASRYTPAGLEDPNSQSSQANKLVARATGDEPVPGFIVLLPTGAKARANAGERTERHVTVSAILEQLSVSIRIRKVEKAILADPEVGRVRSALEAGPKFVSRDGTLSYITVQFRAGSERDHVESARRLAQRLDHLSGVRLGGSDLVTSQASGIIAEDARSAELFALPILLLLLLVFFRGVVAAILPLIIGGSAIALTQAALRVATEFVTISSLVLIVVGALGVGLAIDYSLLIVSRFREELARSADLAQALERAMCTAGRTVLFSALTVAAAFSSLLVLPQSFFYSMGLGGALVTVTVCLVSLTVLPALLLTLGPRVNSLAPAWLQRSRVAVAQPVLNGRWYRLATAVMRRPLLVAIVAATVLIALGLPALGIKLTMPSMSTMPPASSVRQVSDALQSDFKVNPTSLDQIVTVGATRPQLAAYRRSLERLPTVTTIFPVQHFKRSTAAFYLSSSARESSPAARTLVARVRHLSAPFPVKVSGATASFVDLTASVRRHLVLGTVLIALTTMLSIFLLTGSVILPVKTLLMNALTAAAAVGVLVVVFQDGFLHQLLGYPATGAIEITNPIALVAIVFGVATDYGVFLIDRIRETHDNGSSNEQAIALGLERTGRITTTAALLLCVTVGSLLTSRIPAVRQTSLGLAVAIVLDATVVRVLLVPSMMRMLGELNWWSPVSLPRARARSWRPPAASSADATEI